MISTTEEMVVCQALDDECKKSILKESRCTKQNAKKVSGMMMLGKDILGVGDL